MKILALTIPGIPTRSNVYGRAVFRRSAKWFAATALAVALASCGKAPPPPPRPTAPPPPPLIQVPPKPTPPNGASITFAIPPLDASGQRQSISRNISTMQSVWNLRSAFNVAALYCNKPQHAAIVVRYRAFLKANARTLNKVNKAVDAEFRATYGKKAIVMREAYLTAVYNHYALPPTQAQFCDTLLNVSAEGVKVKSADLSKFATATIPLIETVFDDFFTRYEQYRIALADWQVRYEPLLASGRAVISYDLAPTSADGQTFGTSPGYGAATSLGAGDGAGPGWPAQPATGHN